MRRQAFVVPDSIGRRRHGNPAPAGRDHRGRLFWLLFWRSKKVTRPPGRTPGLSPRQCSGVASPGNARAALSVLTLTLTLTFSSKLQLLLRSDVFTADKTNRLHCRHDQAGNSPRQATLFFASPKKRGKKGDPVIAPRCAGSPCRRRLKRGAAKLAPLRSTQTDAAPYPLQASPSRRAQRDFTATATSKTTATATATPTPTAPTAPTAQRRLSHLPPLPTP